ncbi:MAG TPA: hypothetical protein VF312_10295 [Propionibacteriaceae bacterium]
MPARKDTLDDRQPQASACRRAYGSTRIHRSADRPRTLRPHATTIVKQRARVEQCPRDFRGHDVEQCPRDFRGHDVEQRPRHICERDLEQCVAGHIRAGHRVRVVDCGQCDRGFDL